MSDIENVSIKFKPAAYRLFRSLKYKVWLALSEYVDNSVQSYLYNKVRLNEINAEYQFKIDITYKGDYIVIRDNAAGINSEDILRAFEPANIPDNNSGLNEFGMGMKTASIWLAEYWSVRTASIDEHIERFIEFDLKEVAENDREELPIKFNHKESNIHFTEITLQKLTDNAKNKQIERLKKHITSIHRNLIRTGELQIKFNDQILLFETPKILVAPFYKDTEGEIIEWKKEIEFSLGKYSIKGFIGILDKMSNAQENGFALFRRGRVIEGSHDEKYRPKSLSGQIGSPRYKRIFGEFELEGFEVSFDKGSFSNPEELEYFLEQVKNEISKDRTNIFLQAENYRLPKAKEENKKVVDKTVENFNKNKQEKIDNPAIFEKIVEDVLNPKPEATPELIDDSKKVGGVIDRVQMSGKIYNLEIDFIDDKNISQFYQLETIDHSKATDVKCSINLAHPFFIKYDIKDYSPLLQIIKCLIYAELTAPSMGTTKAGNVRVNFNKFIRE